LVIVTVHDVGDKAHSEDGDRLPIADVPVRITQDSKFISQRRTNDKGRCELRLEFGTYDMKLEACGYEECRKICVEETNWDKPQHIAIDIPVGLSIDIMSQGTSEPLRSDQTAFVAEEGKTVQFRVTHRAKKRTTLRFKVGGTQLASHQQRTSNGAHETLFFFNTSGLSGRQQVSATLLGSTIVKRASFPVIPGDTTKVALSGAATVSGNMAVTMRRAAGESTRDIPLWAVIRKSTDALSFSNYNDFMNYLLCGAKLPGRQMREQHINEKTTEFTKLRDRRHLPFADTDAYRILKVATEAFVMVHCGVVLDSFHFDDEEERYVTERLGVSGDHLDRIFRRYLVSVNGSDDETLPYLRAVRDKLGDSPLKAKLFEDLDELDAGQMQNRRYKPCNGILESKLTAPCLLELIWSYWHEEGMLVQTLNAITRRFQNVRNPSGADPLANLEIDPLRPLNNLLWGYVQDEQHRLSVVRRNYEYDHHYGLSLQGKAVKKLRSADTRSKFLEALHHLLHLCTNFYKQDDNTTIVADAFPVLNGLKEVHLILSEGAHNQFGDLPWTARVEMLMQQWLLARPEFREFLPTRIMVAYPEPWMDRVDAMKKLQGWSDTNVLHFRNLGKFGEQILLGIRYGNWSDVHDAAQAANWARFWRPEIQGYVHAYRSATGVDLGVVRVGTQVDTRLPSKLIGERIAQQQRTS